MPKDFYRATVYLVGATWFMAFFLNPGLTPWRWHALHGLMLIPIAAGLYIATTCKTNMLGRIALGIILFCAMIPMFSDNRKEMIGFWEGYRSNFVVAFWLGLLFGFVTTCLRSLLPKWPLGYCATCGYDLRATPQRCPECGREEIGA